MPAPRPSLHPQLCPQGVLESLVTEAQGQCTVFLNGRMTQGWGQARGLQPEFDSELCDSPRDPGQVLNVTVNWLPHLLNGYLLGGSS